MKRIILCADDYGQNEAISQAILALLEKNHLSATSCMTTSTAWPDHAKWLVPFKNQADIGLHFNLTEGKPLSKALLASHGFMGLSKLLVRAYWYLLDAQAIEIELNAQIDAFQEAMGQLPDFLDGHQHVHQLPVVRKVILKVYDQRLRRAGSYIRCVHTPRSFFDAKHRASVKGLIIQLLGAGALKRACLNKKIPHNSSFAGIYQFGDKESYRELFKDFLTQVQDNGIIMCHPGLKNELAHDAISASRYNEFQYLDSEEMLQDCRDHEIEIARLKQS